MGKAAETCAFVQGHDGIGGQSTEAHARNIEYGKRVRLFPPCTHRYPKILVFELRGNNRMIDPLIARRLLLQLAAKGAPVGLTLGALIHNGALQACERDLVGIRVHEVLLDLRPHCFYQIAHMADNGIVAQNSMPALKDVMQSDRHQHSRHHDKSPMPIPEGHSERSAHQCKKGKDKYQMTQGKHRGESPVYESFTAIVAGPDLRRIRLRTTVIR